MLPPPQMVPIFDFSPFRIKHVLLLLLCVLFAEKSSNEKTNYKKCQKWLSLCRQGKCFPVSQLLKNILKSKLFSSSAQSVCWCHVLFWTWKYVKNTYQLFIYARGKLTHKTFIFSAPAPIFPLIQKMDSCNDDLLSGCCAIHLKSITRMICIFWTFSTISSFPVISWLSFCPNKIIACH